MSNYLAIAAVTAALGRTLQATVGVDVPGAVVTTVRPNGPSSGVPETGVNIYLYQVTPNMALGNVDLVTRRADGTLVQRPQIALDLHYLLSFYGSETTLEPQRLLGSTVRTLHARPILSRQAIRSATAALDFLATADLATAAESVKLAPLSLNLEELSKIWSVFFQVAYTLSVAYVAAPVLISPDEEPELSRAVEQPAVQITPSLSGAGAAVALPDSLASLQLWYRADAGVTYDSQGRVSLWRDQSGNDSHAVQSQLDRQPIFARELIRGRPAIRFDGSNDYLAIQNLHYNTPGAINGLTLFALVRSSVDAAQILASFDANHYWRLYLRRSPSALGLRWITHGQAGDLHNLSSPLAYTDGSWHLVSVRFAAGAAPNKQIFVDGTQVASAAAHAGSPVGSGVTRFGFLGVGSAAATFDGSKAPQHYLNGELGEFVLYDRALPDPEREQVERYFIDKYSR